MPNKKSGPGPNSSVAPQPNPTAPRSFEFYPRRDLATCFLSGPNLVVARTGSRHVQLDAAAKRMTRHVAFRDCPANRFWIWYKYVDDLCVFPREEVLSLQKRYYLSTPGWVMDRKSSIENEPRTLGADQLQFAREAALYVIHSRSMEDALRVFTEGLEPVVGARQRDEEGLRRARMESAGPRDLVSSSSSF